MTGKGWLRHEYKDKLALDPICTAVEIVPKDDLRAHVSLADCPCLPVAKEENGVSVLIHNSFDGRESTEPDYREVEH